MTWEKRLKRFRRFSGGSRLCLYVVGDVEPGCIRERPLALFFHQFAQPK